MPRAVPRSLIEWLRELKQNWQETADTSSIGVDTWHSSTTPGFAAMEFRETTGFQNWWSNSRENGECIESKVKDYFHTNMQTENVALLRNIEGYMESLPKREGDGKTHELYSRPFFAREKDSTMLAQQFATARGGTSNNHVYGCSFTVRQVCGSPAGLFASRGAEFGPDTLPLHAILLQWRTVPWWCDLLPAHGRACS